MISPLHYLYTTKQLKCSKFLNVTTQNVQKLFRITTKLFRITTQNYYSEYLEITKLKNYTELLLRIFRTYSELWDHEICPKSSFIVFLFLKQATTAKKQCMLNLIYLQLYPDLSKNFGPSVLAVRCSSKQ